MPRINNWIRNWNVYFKNNWTSFYKVGRYNTIQILQFDDESSWPSTLIFSKINLKLALKPWSTTLMQVPISSKISISNDLDLKPRVLSWESSNRIQTQKTTAIACQCYPQAWINNPWWEVMKNWGRWMIWFVEFLSKNSQWLSQRFSLNSLT
jgi:hypothetical protein